MPPPAIHLLEPHTHTSLLKSFSLRPTDIDEFIKSGVLGLARVDVVDVYWFKRIPPPDAAGGGEKATEVVMVKEEKSVGPVTPKKIIGRRGIIPSTPNNATVPRKFPAFKSPLRKTAGTNPITPTRTPIPKKPRFVTTITPSSPSASQTKTAAETKKPEDLSALPLETLKRLHQIQTQTPRLERLIDKWRDKSLEILSVLRSKMGPVAIDTATVPPVPPSGWLDCREGTPPPMEQQTEEQKDNGWGNDGFVEPRLPTLWEMVHLWRLDPTVLGSRYDADSDAFV
ncbi:hypothetical protein DFS34DRAFT_646658 [Phlyctochytrium arcticum]|nr:hypothetical protein DFS34DRAFT_646658 [Phlyctochytrium arcticum]